MSGSITKSVGVPGVSLEFNIETTGYAGGDSSITTISLRPDPGYQHDTRIHTQGLGYDDWSTEHAEQICFSAHGDIELDALRGAIKEMDRALDQILGIPRSIPQTTTHSTIID